MLVAVPAPAPPRPLLTDLLLALLVGLSALAVRSPGLGRSLWYDELFTLAHFAGSPGAALGRQVAANNHPPASLLAFLIGLLNESEVALRLPFVLAGALAAAALTYGVARALGPATGFLAGALLALAPTHVLASQQVRGYALMSLGGAVALGAALLLVRSGAGRDDRRLLVAVGLGAALGTWAHATWSAATVTFLAAILLAGWRGWIPRRDAARAGGALAGGLVLGVLLLAPVLGRTWKFVRRNVTVAPAEGVHPGPLTPLDLLALLGGDTTPTAIALGAALAALGAVGAATLLRAPGRRGAAALLLGPPAAAVALAAVGALGYPRFMLFALPAALVLAARGIVALTPHPTLRAALVAACLIPLGLQVARDADRELQDLRGGVQRAQALSERAGGAAIVALGPGAELLRAYGVEVEGDPAGTSVAAGTPPAAVVWVVPFPAWLETAPAPARQAVRRGGARWLLPGRESPVLVVGP